MLKKWDKLPEFMKIDEVKPYYDILSKKKFSLFVKRVFDITVALIMLIILSPLIIVVSILIACGSKGGVFYRQERVTKYGKIFRIHKFRTMVANADKVGSLVTTAQDNRITGIGKVLRKLRIDEVPQLFDIIAGNMTFVGTRPEVKKYVDNYTPEMIATLLLPAGLTSEASVRYKDESELLDNAEDVDKVYVEQVLPAKMKYNLESIKSFGFFKDIGTMFKTAFAVLGKNYD